MRVEECLKTFSHWARKFPGPIADSVQFSSDQPGPTKLVTACVHGDEVGSLPGINEAIKRLDEKTWQGQGKIIFALGNPKAILAGKRFLKADLNRQFLSQLGDHDEARRALELSSLLTSVDYHLDLHQTIEPSRHCFYLAENEVRSLSLAAYFGRAPYLIEVPAELNKKYGTFMGAAMEKNVAHICLEMFQKGFSEEVTELTLAHIEKLLDLKESLLKEMTLGESVQRLRIVYQEKFADPKTSLKPGWQNFTEVKAQQVIGTFSNGEPIKVPHEGFLLFPKYPVRDKEGRVLEEIPKSIYELAVKIEKDPKA